MERYPKDFDHGEVSFSPDTKEFQSRSVARTSVRLYPLRTEVHATLISAVNLPETTIGQFSQAIYNRENSFRGILYL